MNDILTRLLLDTKDFDGKLGRAKQSSDDFSSVLKDKVGGALKTVAATIGLAVGAAETFNKVIHSSQSTSDAWNNALSACKGTVDAFFQSLSTGNWRAFNNGLEATLVKMREVAVLKDMLGDAKLSMGFDTRMFERDYVRLEAIIDDETKSLAERQEAYKKMEEIIASYNEKVNATAKGASTTLVAELNANFGLDYSIDDVRDYVSNYNNEHLNNEQIKNLRAYKKELAELEKQQFSYTTSVAPGSIWGGSVTVKTENTDITARINALKEQNKELEKMRMLSEDNDENRAQMVKDYEYIFELQQRGAEYEKRSLEKQNKLLTLNKSDGPSASSEAVTLPMIIDVDNGLNYKNEIGQKMMKALKTGEPLPVITQPVVIEEEVEEAPLPTFEDKTKKIEDLNTALSATGSIFGNLGSIVGNFGDEFGAFALNTVGQIAQMIIQLQALATANGVASASKLPFPASLAAVATVVATIASVFASLPKFAEGGVVGGSSFFGDKLLARVNSGETILTQNQAARALSLMGGSDVRVTGDVRLNGKDIYISLRNYMSTSGNKL